MFKAIFFGAFLFFALIFALCGMLKGRKYKWQFSAARMILLVIATLISTVISALIGWVAGGLLLGFLPMAGPISGLLEAMPSAPEALKVVVAMIIAPVVFIIIFNIFRPIVNLFTSPFCKLLLKLGKKVPAKKESVEESSDELEGAQAEVVASEEIPEKKKKARKYDKFRSEKKFDPFGALIGALCSVLILIVLLVPLVGVLSFANPIVQVVVTPDDPTTEMICEISDAAANNAGAKTVNILGGKAVWSVLTTYPFQGEWTSAPRETDFLSGAISAIVKMNDADVPRDEAAKSFRDMSARFDKAVMMPTLVSELLSASSESWSAGEAFCGIPALKLGDAVDPVVKDFYGIMKDSSPETIRGDFKTISNVMAVVVEHDAVSAMKGGSDGMLGFFRNEPLVSGIMLEFLENDRMSSLVGSMTNLGLSIFADQLGVDDTTEGKYDEFIAEMTAAYGEVETHDAASLEVLSDKIAKVYDNHGISLSGGVATCIALDMMDTLAVGDEAEIKAFFKKAPVANGVSSEGDVPVVMLASGDAPGSAALMTVSAIAAQSSAEMTREELAALIAAEFSRTDIEFTEEALASLSSDLAGKMYDDIKANKFSYKNGAISSNSDIEKKTVKLTKDDLTVEMKAVSDKEQEAKAIAKVFAATLSTADQLSQEGVKTSDIIISFGPVLDDFASSEIIGEDVTANVLTSILQSSKVRGNIGFTLVQATNMANKINKGARADEDYAVLLKSLGTTVDIISTSANKSGNTAEAVEELMQDITPTSAEVLQELSTPDTVKNYGVPDRSAGAVSGMMSDMFGNMSSAKEEGRLTEEEYARESLAVSDMMAIAMSAGKSGESATFGENSATNITATEFVDRATNSVVISETLVNTVYGEAEDATVDPLASNRALSEEEKSELVGAIDAKWQAQLENSSDEAANAEYQKTLTSVASIVNVNIAFTADGVVAVQ